MARRTLPKLPAEVFSVLGPVPVTENPSLVEKREALGLASFRPRTIQVDQGSTRQAQWQYLWHEMVHYALWDAGVTNGLSHEQEEAVCDAVGTYMAAAMLGGYVKVAVPKE